MIDVRYRGEADIPEPYNQGPLLLRGLGSRWREKPNSWQKSKATPGPAFNSCRAMTNAEYYLITSQSSERPERWSWEIRRRSTPLGVKLTADGFQSEAAAKFAGKRALDEFLFELSKEESRTRG